MKRYIILAAALAVASILVARAGETAACAAAGGSAATDAPGSTSSRQIDPFIGTGAHGHTYPGASLPFGMVQVGPDTRLSGWDGSSGYHDSDRFIYGFSHTHLSGTGIPDYGDILLMPIAGAVRLENGHRGDRADPAGGYASRFEKRTESAGAGWYGVTLADTGIQVELTATERTGWHRYRFPPGAQAHVVIDLTHRDELLDFTLRVATEREVEGCRRSTGWARDQTVCFAAAFSRPFAASHIEGPKGSVSFSDDGGELIVKVGLSAVDIEGAWRNLEAESPGWDFEAARRQAVRRWVESLGRVDIQGGAREQRVVFDTALYHALLVPNLFSDVDGRYRGMDGRIHQAEGRRHYTVFSLWDTFRAEHPLLNILEPARTAEFIQTFLAQAREGGKLPVWELAGNETDTMIGYHAVPVIADAWVKGIRGFDAEEALEAMRHSATLDHFGLAAYKRQGFIGSDDAPESVSRTLEYAYDDFCVARMAGGLGRDDLAAEFSKRAQGWRHLLDPDTGFMRPRVGQRWLDPFDPSRVDNNYTEANAWQYSLFVPQDIEGLIETVGGDDRFIARLDALFEADSRTSGRDLPDMTGLIGQYVHGNEPSHHLAWLYHYAGRPDRSASRVRRILDTLYDDSPSGLAGNEDCGQISAWYVMAAMGLYSVCPCTDEYLIVPPLFERISLSLEQGRTFTIHASPPPREGLYVVSASLNDRPLRRSFLRHEEIAAGGLLELKLGPRPDAQWGRRPEDRPRSRVGGERVIPAPFVRRGAERFRDEAQVELACAEQGATIRYTMDASLPASEWPVYREPFALTGTSRLSMRAERDGRSSPTVEATFHHMPNDWRIVVPSVPDPQYTAGGPDALIDGLRGAAEWRAGRWQGYQLSDFEATVDLRRTGAIHRAGAGFLQDVRSWIWMPREVVVSVSMDGERFTEAARLVSGVPEREEGVVMRDLVADLDGVTARYVRIFARAYGAIPDSHPGRGGRGFIFVDEIVIE